MIKIKPANTEPICEPYYRMVYNYMIGDARGNTTYETIVSIENPYVEKYMSLINSLKPIKNHWGIVFERNRLRQHFNEGQITEDDYNFLNKMMFDEYDYDNDEEAEAAEQEEDEYAWQFAEGVRGETEYSFLVFEGIDLFYVDCFGIEHETMIVEDEPEY